MLRLQCTKCTWGVSESGLTNRCGGGSGCSGGNGSSGSSGE